MISAGMIISATGSDALSTKRRQTGIVMDVHPVLRGITEASQLQLPRTEPDEQPIESSHLENDDLYSEEETVARREAALSFWARHPLWGGV